MFFLSLWNVRSVTLESSFSHLWGCQSRCFSSPLCSFSHPLKLTLLRSCGSFRGPSNSSLLNCSKKLFILSREVAFPLTASRKTQVGELGNNEWEWTIKNKSACSSSPSTPILCRPKCALMPQRLFLCSPPHYLLPSVAAQLILHPPLSFSFIVLFFACPLLCLPPALPVKVAIDAQATPERFKRKPRGRAIDCQSQRMYNVTSNKPTNHSSENLLESRKRISRKRVNKELGSWVRWMPRKWGTKN